MWSWEEEDEQQAIGIPGASWTRLSWATTCLQAGSACLWAVWYKITFGRQNKHEKDETPTQPSIAMAVAMITVIPRRWWQEIRSFHLESGEGTVRPQLVRALTLLFSTPVRGHHNLLASYLCKSWKRAVVLASLSSTGQTALVFTR